MTSSGAGRNLRVAWEAILQGDHDRGRRILRAHLSINPKDIRALRLLANSREMTKNYEHALRIHRNLLRLNPRDLCAVVDCADCFAGLGKISLAQCLYQIVIKMLHYSPPSRRNRLLLEESRQGLLVVKLHRNDRTLSRNVLGFEGRYFRKEAACSGDDDVGLPEMWAHVHRLLLRTRLKAASSTNRDC